MKKIVRALAATGAVALLGVVVLPLTAYAATTAVEVNIGSECLIGDGLTGSNYEGAGMLQVTLSAATPYNETTATSGTNLIGAICNATDGYTITEAVDHTTLNLAAATGGPYTGASGFSVGAGNATLASFANNTWSIKYADVTGTTVASGAQTYNRSPSTTPTAIASTAGPTSLSTFSQQFGAKTDGTVPDGYYGAVITYTLTPNP